MYIYIYIYNLIPESSQPTSGFRRHGPQHKVRLLEHVPTGSGSLALPEASAARQRSSMFLSSEIMVKWRKRWERTGKMNRTRKKRVWNGVLLLVLRCMMLYTSSQYLIRCVYPKHICVCQLTGRNQQTQFIMKNGEHPTWTPKKIPREQLCLTILSRLNCRQIVI